jgi:hypothetical protein
MFPLKTVFLLNDEVPGIPTLDFSHTELEPESGRMPRKARVAPGSKSFTAPERARIGEEIDGQERIVRPLLVLAANEEASEAAIGRKTPLSRF